MRIFEVKEDGKSYLCSKIKEAKYLLEEIEDSLKDMQSDTRDHRRESDEDMYRDYRSYRR